MSVFLVVDDEPMVQRFFRSTVEHMGHEARVTGSYAEAVELIRNESWDIALFDIVLGSRKETGIQLLRIARDVAPDSPVLMVTAFPDLKSAQEAVRLEAFDYIVKPIHADRLVTVLERALTLRRVFLERRRLERENLRVRQRLEAVFNSVLDGIVTVDRQGTVLDLNGAAASLLGLSLEEAVGLPLREVCSQGLEPIVSAVEKSFETDEFVREYQVNGQTEEPRWTYVISVVPLRAGVEEGAVLVIRDISRLCALEREVSDRFSFESIIGKSPAMLKVFRMIRDLADTNTTVLIQGPSGTGKELVGMALHYHGARQSGPLVKVNCAGLPETLLESELFGHVRGAFTGATRDKIGRFERAHGGTIFLDEIGDMSPHLQQRLLRVLQEHEFERVGSTETIKVDVRVVATTNHDLSELVARGVLREDLYYRLKVVTIDLPPLRERREDIPLLIRHFLQEFAVSTGRVIRSMDPAAMGILLQYHWPGNVRQLEHALEHAVVLSHDGFIRPENLPPELLGSQKTVTEECHTQRPMPLERLREVLDSVGWNRSRAARRLGVHRNTVSRWIRLRALVPPSD